jgi:hypothetical protein
VVWSMLGPIGPLWATNSNNWLRMAQLKVVHAR